MSSLNKVILIGRFGKDPEVREVNGTTVANFTLATSESWKDKATGEKVDRVEWHRAVVWGAQANFVGKYLTKGSLVYLEGQLQTREWLDKENSKRYTTEVKVDRIRGLGGRSNSETETDTESEPVEDAVVDIKLTEADKVPF